MWIVNYIKDEGARMLSESLKCNSSLATLVLECGEERKELELMLCQ